MADKKISALTSASTPLAGTETLPFVQSGATVKVPTNDLTVRNIRAATTTGILQVSGPTAGTTRTATVPDANWTAARTDAAQSFTGDQTLSTGNLVVSNGKGIDFSATPGAGTSELLDDYEEGTFTPSDESAAGLTITVDHAVYTKVGRLVTVNGYITYPANADVNNARINLPFACPYFDIGLASSSTGNVASLVTIAASNVFEFRNASLVRQTNASLSGADILFTFSYTV
jgi:hypothetical protein